MAKMKTYEDRTPTAIIVPATSLIFIPSNYDTFNLPKMVAFVLTINLLILINYKKLKNKLPSSIKNWNLIACIIVTIGVTNSSSLTSGILGNYAQNTGWLVLISCIILTNYIFKLLDENQQNDTMKSIAASGAIMSLYGVIQKLGLDPVKWRTEGWITSTLGNPNFVASFLAIASLTSLILSVFEKKQKKKFLYFTITIINIVGCLLANSDQGYAIIVVGFIAILLINIVSLYKSKLKSFLKYSVSFVSCILILFLIYFQQTIYLRVQNSLQFRIFYWEASLRIFQNNSLLGVGYGNFEDGFFEHRSLNHFLKGQGEYAASAHNYFLEFFALGGVLLGFAYLAFCVYVTKALIQILKRDIKTSPKELQFLCVGWLGYLVQSFVSIPIVPMLVLGSVISAFIIKSAYLDPKINQAKQYGENLAVRKKEKRFIRQAKFISLAVNLALSIHLLYQEKILRDVVQMQPTTKLELTEKIIKVNELIENSLNREEYSYLLAKNLFNQGLGYEAEPIMETSLDSNLHAYSKSWYLVYFNFNLNRIDKALPYFYQAISLDPVNLNLRRDLILMLQKNNRMNEAKIELEKLKKLAPSSDQYTSLFKIKDEHNY